MTSAPDSPRNGAGPMSVFAALVAVVAFLFATLAVGLSFSRTPTASVAAATTVPVTLSEFHINPTELKAPAGRIVLKLLNSGSTAHNLRIEELGKQSLDIAPGKTGELEIAAAAPGTYEVICTIAGHSDSGMKGTLVVTAAGEAASATAADGMAGMDHSAGGATDYAAMDAKMTAGMAAGMTRFGTPAAATSATGNQVLAPTIGADGAKEFRLESSIIDWEVEKGKTVKAWAYNGQVPGPWIRVLPNDKVRVILKNSLPVSTDIHFHGIDTPFNQDGVAPLTQPAIKPGETYTYEFTTSGQSELGMYHAHAHGDIAVLNGMFAAFQVGSVPLPTGRTVGGRTLPADLTPTKEMPMVLNDAGTIGLTLNGKSFPSTDPVSIAAGQRLLVHYYNEGLMPHPMHLHHVPGLVVAKDGFPLDAPYWMDTINVAPGERYSVLVMPDADDFGTWAWHCHILNHAERDDGLFGMVTAFVVTDPTKPTT